MLLIDSGMMQMSNRFMRPSGPTNPMMRPPHPSQMQQQQQQQQQR